MKKLDKKILRDLVRMRGQAAAIVAVIAAGVGVFLMYRSAFDSLSLTRDAYYERQRFGDVFAAAKRVPGSVEAKLAEIPGIATLETRVVAEVTLDLPGMDEPAAGRLISIPARGRPRVNDLFLRKGRWIEPARPDEVLASESFAKAHRLEPGDSLSAVIAGRKRKLAIVGIALSPEYVYSIRPGDLLPDPARFGALWMEEKALAAAFDLTGSFNDVTARLAPGASSEDVLARIDGVLARYGGLGAIPRAHQTSYWYLENEIIQLENVGSFLPMIFLGVAAFLLNVVLSRVVSVEREQIAALKAMGYSNLEVGLHYAKLGLLIALCGTVLGGFLGAWLGSAITRLYTDFFSFPVLVYHLAPSRLLQGGWVALAAAGLGAVAAVYRAVALPPAEAMRPEPPAAHRVSAVERAGLRRLLSAPSRMILRNLARRPLRTALAVVGIAAGASLVVVGTNFRDSIEALLDEQFGVLDRQDATVTFREPVSQRVLHDLARLPGVVRVEPLRAVAVEITHGSQRRRATLQGLIAAPRLHRVVDASARPVPLPADGLVLSTSLAEALGVDRGDLVSVEALEGTRAVRSVPVAFLVEQHMGLAAYMHLPAVRRFLREAPALSGAFLQVEPSRAEGVFRRLKDSPKVAAVSRKAAFIESFRANVAKSMDIVLVFAIFFAIVITFGVVYNTARISLSERSRELASLRVLGFRRSEISYILLGELAVLAGAAIPVGFAFGAALAWLALDSFGSELYRFPLVFTRQSFAMAGLTVVVASLVSGLVVRRKLDHLDLIAVLKTRE